MPGLLPWAVVPSPSLCFSAGLWEHPPRLCKVPGMEEAQLPGRDASDTPDWRVLGEDNPQAPRPGPTCPWGGLCSCASPALLQPGAQSLELHPPSLPSSTQPPRALLQALLPSLPPGC